MSRVIDMSDVESMTDEDFLYLAQRGQLPKGMDVDDERLAKILRGERTELADLANTGDVNTSGKTVEDLEREAEVAEKENEMAQQEAEKATRDAEAKAQLSERDYAELKKEVLQEELQRRGLSSEGNKAELVSRLDADDEGN